MLQRQLFGSAKLLHFEPDGLPELDLVPEIEDGFTFTLANMDMNGLVIIAVEEEAEPFFGKDGRHCFEF